MKTNHNTTLSAVAAHLGATYTGPDPDHWACHGTLHFGPEDFTFEIYQLHGEKNLTIRPSAPRTWRADRSGIKATFNPARPPAAIAADIRRRCITPGLTWIRQQWKQHHEREATTRDKLAFLADLFAPLNPTPEQIRHLCEHNWSQLSSLGPLDFYNCCGPDPERNNITLRITATLPAFRLILKILAEDWKITEQGRKQHEAEQQAARAERHRQRAEAKQNHHPAA
jgi:hypothetical protein